MITDHLSGEWSVTIGTQTAPVLQQRKGKGFGRASSQERRPSVPPHLASPRAQMPGLPSGLGLRQLVEELAAFLGPPASHFPGQDHKPCATPLACELWVDPLLPTRAAIKAAPSWVVERWRGTPSRLRTDTNVVFHTQLCLPKTREAHQPSPDSGCPTRLEGSGPCPARGRSRTLCPLPRDKPVRPHFPLRTLDVLEPLPLRHQGRVAGHTGSGTRQWREEGVKGGVEEARGTAESRNGSDGRLGNW